MKINKADERNLFLTYIAEIFKKCPSANADTVYKELILFYTENVRRKRIEEKNLVGVQTLLFNRFNKKATVFSNGYFFVIQNERGKEDEEFYDAIGNGVKIYVSVDAENLYKIAETLMDFMLKENIIMQSKFARFMRNDVFVIRTDSVKSATKICNYLNSIKYNSIIHPNPFTMGVGKAYVTLDGDSSYNTELSKLIADYMKIKKSLGKLNDVSIDDFMIFLNRRILFQDKLFEEKNFDKMNIELFDKQMIAKVIYGVLDDTMDMKQIEEYQSLRIHFTNMYYKYKTLDKALQDCYNYHGNEYELRIKRYLDTGKADSFTRTSDIRKRIMCFNPSELKQIFMDKGWEDLLEASLVTIRKYNFNQLVNSFTILFEDDSLTGFSNDNNVRNKLALTPKYLLREIVMNKAFSLGTFNISPENIASMINGYLQEANRSYGNGRK